MYGLHGQHHGCTPTRMHRVTVATLTIIPDDSSDMFDAFWTPYIKNNAVFYLCPWWTIDCHLSVELAGCTAVVDGVMDGSGRGLGML